MDYDKSSMKFSNPFGKQFLPKSILCLKDYSARIFAADLAAGVTVGLVALPLAMAFAIASGMTPQAGIYCAVVTGFLISLLGGSRTQIGGPTGAFVVVVVGIIVKHGVQGLFLCTMMAGVMLVIMGLTGLGKAVQFIPRPVVMGFTNGIAVLIASTQIRDFFGLRLEHNPGEFFARMRELIAHAGNHLAARHRAQRGLAHHHPGHPAHHQARPRIHRRAGRRNRGRGAAAPCRWKPSARASEEFPPACRTCRFPSFTPA